MLAFSEILKLVGPLDDSPGQHSARERFRSHLFGKVTSAGQVRDYVEECLRNSGDQYNRALQDLVNHLGVLLGFDVTFGRYRGVQGEIGFDGLWLSPQGLSVVVEVKTTDAYAIKTATLLNYMNELVSAKTIPSLDQALGLYVVGRTENELRQLENSIIAEKLTDRLRVVTPANLLTLSELLTNYDMEHNAVLTVLKPSLPVIDPIIELMARMVSLQISEAVDLPETASEEDRVVVAHTRDSQFYITPVAPGADCTAQDVVEELVNNGVWAFGKRTPHRTAVNPGDWICFHASGAGVVAHARVASRPGEDRRHPLIRDPEEYPYVLTLDESTIYTKTPRVLDAETRASLDAFEGKHPSKAWGWFVVTTRRISKHDFVCLTRQH